MFRESGFCQVWDTSPYIASFTYLILAGRPVFIKPTALALIAPIQPAHTESSKTFESRLRLASEREQILRGAV
jgi:hypothetical protein